MEVTLYRAAGGLHLVWEDPAGSGQLVTTTTAPWEGGLPGDVWAIANQQMRSYGGVEALAEVPEHWTAVARAESDGIDVHRIVRLVEDAGDEAEAYLRVTTIVAVQADPSPSPSHRLFDQEADTDPMSDVHVRTWIIDQTAEGDVAWLAVLAAGNNGVAVWEDGHVVIDENAMSALKLLGDGQDGFVEHTTDGLVMWASGNPHSIRDSGPRGLRFGRD